VRVIVICVGLFLTAGAVSAQGDYQRTKDGKTLVWNDEPKPGDAAVWSGDRDAEGYATGAGTLVWYQANGHVFGRYFGNMVKGRFDGEVNVHSNGRTAHAIFENGKRASIWVRGPAPSRSEIDRRLTLMAEPVEKPREKGPKTEEKTVQKEPIVRKAQPVVPSENIEASTPKSVAVEAPKKQSAIVETPVEQSSPSPTLNPTPKDLASEGAKQETQRLEPDGTEIKTEAPIPKLSPTEPTGSQLPTFSSGSGLAPGQVHPDSGLDARLSEQEQRKDAANPPLPPLGISPARPTPEQIVIQPLIGGETPKQEAASGTVTSLPPVSEAKARMDQSLGALVRPPSALHITSVPTPSPTASIEKIEATPTPNAGAHLTQEEAIALADSEARNQGYDLGEFRRPKADYSAANHRWSLFYDQKSGSGMPEIGKYFTATVDDATKKAQIRQ
jgi:hypothetical protein